ncbi:MAG TPA: sugar ABC transporter ATP-binding protein [Lachnospiraceae bacterium]|nr:sugar ABC transporter ATP-binding protein [Lachnospiraceae bacterium]
MERVTYQEQGVTLLENFSMTIWAGEIMGLVPVNHYGLGALIELLLRNHPLHYGYVYYHEKQVNHWRYPKYGVNRISVIKNKSCLAGKLTVTDNIFVLRPGFKKHVIRQRLLERQLQPFLKDIGIRIRADEYVENLTAFERLVVEILKAVVAGCYLVILEDIGTFVSDSELAKLHEILRHYADQGMSFLYIAAHFEEVRQICDRTALMMNGRITKIFQASDEIPDTLSFECTEDFERHVREQIEKRPDASKLPTAAFEIRHLCYGNIHDLNLRVTQGECLVVQDMSGSLFQDFLCLLPKGKLKRTEGVLIDGMPCGRAKRHSVAFIQESPVKSMLFPDMSYMENLCFTMDHKLPFVWLNKRIQNGIRKEFEQVLGKEVFDMRVEKLSKTQKYDLIYTRILLQNPKVVFCVAPFKGAEVSLRIHIMKLIETLLEKKIAVVILTVNLADSLALAERVICIRENGEIQSYNKENFGKLPVTTPWLYLYREKNRFSQTADSDTVLE